MLSGSAPNIGRSIIRESLNYGLFAQSGAGSDATDWFADNQLTANGRSPISIGSNDVSTLGANLALTGNVQDRVFVRGSTVSRANAAWSNYGVPFYLSNGIVVRGGSTMAVAPGTEMRFASNRRLQVSTGTEEGTLVAAGTPALPIRMIADSGAWNGIILAGLIQPGTVLRSVRIEDFSGTVNGGVRVDNPSNPGRPRRHCGELSGPERRSRLGRRLSVRQRPRQLVREQRARRGRHVRQRHAGRLR